MVHSMLDYVYRGDNNVHSYLFLCVQEILGGYSNQQQWGQGRADRGPVLSLSVLEP